MMARHKATAVNPVLRQQRAARDRRPLRSFGRARLWLAACGDCRRRRRGVRLGAGAVQRLAGSVRDVSGAGLAGGRIGRRPLERHVDRRRCRLVLRLRLFRRRALLDRLRLFGRRQDLRLVAAVRGCRAAGLSRDLYRFGTGGRPLDLGARAGAHCGARRHADHRGMAARPSAQRLSLEQLRLCADRTTSAGAKCLPGRRLGIDLPQRRDFRDAGGAGRRQGGYAASATRAAHRARASHRDDGIRTGAAGDAPDQICARRQDCASCSPICSRTKNSTTPPRQR